MAMNEVSPVSFPAYPVTSVSTGAEGTDGQSSSRGACCY